MQLSMFSLEELPVRATASPDSERDWTIRVVTSCCPLLPLLGDIGPDGWRGKTCPESFRTTADEALQHFWDCSPDNASWLPLEDGALRELSQGTKTHTAAHGESLTLSLSEWTVFHAPSLKDEGVSSLSEILTGDVPQRFYLSARACQGILRRAAKRGKALPPALSRALQSVANQKPDRNSESI